MRPNFLYIGPDKSGSSWLFRVLATHPQVYLSPAKDLYFFDRYYNRGSQWYFSRFKEAGPGHKIVGEVCHDYLYSAEAPERIYATLGGDTRILTCLREPADRAFSDYLNRLRSGEEGINSFAAAVARHPEIIESGKYSSWIRNFSSIFPSPSMKIAVFDDLARDPQSFLDQITDWLDISRMQLTADQLAPARPAARSRSRHITRIVRSGAALARRLGLQDLVGRVKSSPGVEAALYRKYDSRPQTDPDVVAHIRAKVRDDVFELSRLTSIPFSQIWQYDNN